MVCTERNKAVVQGFIKLVKSIGPKMGITVKEPSLSLLANDVSIININISFMTFVVPSLSCSLFLLKIFL